MVKIVIENLGQKELFINDPNKTVLQHLHSHSVDWMHACGGKGRCTTCKAIVTEGLDNLSPLSPAELKYRNLKALLPNERLTCQVQLSADIKIRVPDEYKLPHMVYT